MNLAKVKAERMQGCLVVGRQLVRLPGGYHPKQEGKQEVGSRPDLSHAIEAGNLMKAGTPPASGGGPEVTTRIGWVVNVADRYFGKQQHSGGTPQSESTVTYSAV